MGPGQLTPSTAKLLGVSEPFDPAQAIDGSGRYLATQLVTFHDVRLAVAAYNAGPGSSSTGPYPITAKRNSTCARS
jgi:soluble lytic murein transglycosylase-like protein